MSVKEPWFSQKLTEWLSEHGKGGVTRCPAMMSSIGALCGTQACHSFNRPGVCFCVSVRACVVNHTLTAKEQKLSVAQWGKKLVGGGSYPSTREPPPLPVMAMLQFHWRILPSGFLKKTKKHSAYPLILAHNTFILTHTLLVSTHPLTNPQTIHFSMAHKVPSHHSLAFTRWNIPEKRGEKNTWSS